MLKKLRIKFIILNIATVFVVLASVFTFVVVLEYQQDTYTVAVALGDSISNAAERQSHSTQNVSSDQSQENNSTEDKSPNTASTPLNSNEETQALNEQTEADTSNSSQKSLYNGTPPGIGKRDRDRDQIIPMAVFSVSESGSISTIDTNTALISTDVLNQATSQLKGTDEGFGTLVDLGLIYKKATINGTTYIAFADISTANGWQQLALTLVCVGIVAMLIFFVINLFFSPGL